jgi:hypothetical protein
MRDLCRTCKYAVMIAAQLFIRTNRIQLIGSCSSGRILVS